MFMHARGGPVQALQNNVLMIVARITGGGAATDCTIDAGTGRGLSSVTYNAATGCYRATFSHVPAGTFLGMGALGGCNSSTAADAKTVCELKGTFSAANKIVDFLVVDLGATPALVDLATNEGLTLVFYFAETAKP